MFGLAGKRAAMPGELSGGQLKRLSICRALVHRPDVLFLDEPTAGLDPQSRLHLWDSLRTLQAAGQTIVLTTHHLEEAEALCARVAIIDRGALLACDTVERLTATAGADTVVSVRYAGPVPSTVEDLRHRPGVRRLEVTGGQVRVFAVPADGLLADLVAAGAAGGVPVTEASQLRPSLETVFLTLTGREYLQ
jgi:ABC-2 type transport system ATP-binding protein